MFPFMDFNFPYCPDGTVNFEGANLFFCIFPRDHGLVRVERPKWNFLLKLIAIQVQYLTHILNIYLFID